MLLIFKLYVYRSREKQFIHINNLIAEIKSVKTTEKEIATSNLKKKIVSKNKWHITSDITSIIYMNACKKRLLNI